MKSKYKGTIDKNVRLGELIIKAKKQTSSLKGLEIKFNSGNTSIKEIYIIT